MEQSGIINLMSFSYEYIVRVKVTKGTETSQYLEEKKETSIPTVAASEMGGVQTSGLPLGLWIINILEFS